MAEFVPLPPQSDPPVLEPAGVPDPFDDRATAVSFIVCTRNRLAQLQACVASIDIACRSHIAAELIIVDNASADGTAEWLAQTAESLALPIRCVSEPRVGLAAARNAGLENASGRILAFIDDDCEVHPDFIRDLQRHYAADECCVIRGGCVELGNPNDLPFTIKRSPKLARLTFNVHPGGFVLGCNMTMNREVAERLGRFDERFGAGGPLHSAEDTDYLVRAFLLGIPIEYVPDMTVFHNHGRNDRAAVEALHRSYSLGNGGLCLKHLWNAPWLLRHFYWTLRAAFKELWGGPPFDPDLQLSHWPIVVMNLLGGLKFARIVLARLQAAPVRLPPALTKALKTR